MGCILAINNGDKLYNSMINRFDRVESRVDRLERFGVTFGVAIVIELMGVIIILLKGT